MSNVRELTIRDLTLTPDMCVAFDALLNYWWNYCCVRGNDIQILKLEYTSQSVYLRSHESYKGGFGQSRYGRSVDLEVRANSEQEFETWKHIYVLQIIEDFLTKYLVTEFNAQMFVEFCEFIHRERTESGILLVDAMNSTKFRSFEGELWAAFSKGLVPKWKRNGYLSSFTSCITDETVEGYGDACGNGFWMFAYHGGA